MAAPKIRTLLIEDSAFMRIMISDLLRNEPDIELIGSANNGKEGVEKTLALNPDVVITDMVMPTYDGLFAVKNIMKQRPTPIILMSSLERNDTQVFEALEAGAIDFIDKPKGDGASGMKQSGYPLPDLVRAAAQGKAKSISDYGAQKNNHRHVFAEQLNYQIVVIGASTGGPGAVEVILKQLPANLAVPVVIAQHMPAGFIDSFAKRLNASSPLKVKVATKGEIVQAGTIYLASGHANMQLSRHPLNGNVMVDYTDKEFKEFNFPSVDCLMNSVAEVYGSKSIGVILTGMGRDGTIGLSQIKNSKGYTLVQDEQSAVVFGMPKAAWEAGAAHQIVKLNQIAGFIISCL